MVRRWAAWLVIAAALALLAGMRLADSKERHGPPAAEEAGESL